jgi:ABC-type uncharacterized transport system auxiliary subunit
MTARLAAAALAAAALAATALAATGCAGKLPETRHYQLAAPEGKRASGDAVLVLETLSTDAAYDDDRIAYRTTPVRIDYYQYHRWSSSPGTMVSNYLEQALEASGRFRAVVRELTAAAPVILAGRVVAIEEVDRSRTEWLGRIVVELTLNDARTGESLWTEQLEETEPLRERSPEGLAAALSVAMSRIVAHAVPVIADLSDRQARLHAAPPPDASRSSDASRPSPARRPSPTAGSSPATRSSAAR